MVAGCSLACTSHAQRPWPWPRVISAAGWVTSRHRDDEVTTTPSLHAGDTHHHDTSVRTTAGPPTTPHLGPPFHQCTSSLRQRRTTALTTYLNVCCDRLYVVLRLNGSGSTVGPPGRCTRRSRDRSYERESLTLNRIVPTTLSPRFTARGSGRRRRDCLGVSAAVRSPTPKPTHCQCVRVAATVSTIRTTAHRTHHSGQSTASP